MRAPLVATVVLIAASLLAAGCGGGPSDGAKALSKACERQIKQVNEEAHESSTPTAKSTDDRLANVTLQECAGQDIVYADPKDTIDNGNGKSAQTEATDEDADVTKGEAAALDPAARKLFSDNCASCHTLADANATGTFGPNLDDLTIDVATIEHQIVNGGGSMPPGILKGEDATKVAQYVADAAGSK